MRLAVLLNVRRRCILITRSPPRLANSFIQAANSNNFPNLKWTRPMTQFAVVCCLSHRPGPFGSLTPRL
jgi:hypothetical protein